MASARVEHMLDEIARLSHEEQAELLRHLSSVLRSGDSGGTSADARRGLSLNAVQQALELRERIDRRLAAAAQPPGSITTDLDDDRNGRLAELLDSGASVPQDARESTRETGQ